MFALWHALHDKPVLMSTGNNTSLGKRRGQSLVDIFKRPFSRKSMTPPASPDCPSKQQSHQPAKRDSSIKLEEEAAVVTPPVENAAESDDAAQNTLVVNTETNGQSTSDTFALPLPPTPTEVGVFFHSRPVLLLDRKPQNHFVGTR